MRQARLSTIPDPDDFEIVFAPEISEEEERILDLYIQGMTPSEISRRLGISIGRTGRKLQRLRKRGYL